MEVELEIGLLAYGADETKLIVEADTFALYDGKSCEQHNERANKLDRSNYPCKVGAARLVQEELAVVRKEKCPRVNENPSCNLVCSKNNHLHHM